MNESDLLLDPEVRERLEQVLGIEVPDPNSLEFQSLLEELQENQPELFEEVMRGLTVNVEFPAEQQAVKVARRESFYALMTRLIFRRSAVDGEPVAAKRRWLMYVFVAMALLGPGLYILGQTFGRNDTVAQEPQPLAQVDPIDPVQPEAPLTSAPPPAPEPEPEPELPPPAPMPVQAQEPPAPPAPTPPRPVMPPAPTSVAPPPAPAAAPAPPTPVETPVVRPSSLSLYENQAPRPTETTLFDNQPSEGAALPGMTLFEDESGSDTLLISEVEDVAPETLLVVAAEDTTPETMRIDAETIDATERPTQLRIEEPEETSDTVATDGAGTVSEGEEMAAEAPPGKRLEDILQPGARLGAVLETGIIVTQGTMTPVVAKSGSDWCTTPPCPEITWIGQASLDASNRIQITFTQAVFNDATQTISALALGAGNVPGLTASIKDTAPTVAQDLLRSAAGGFTDYIGALSQQKTVAYVDGIAVTKTETPPLDLFILSKMGSIFDLPENTTPIVRIAEVPTGSQLIVLFGISPAGAGTAAATPTEIPQE
jgi:hypothetical protein